MICTDRPHPPNWMSLAYMSESVKSEWKNSTGSLLYFYLNINALKTFLSNFIKMYLLLSEFQITSAPKMTNPKVIYFIRIAIISFFLH